MQMTRRADPAHLLLMDEPLASLDENAGPDWGDPEVLDPASATPLTPGAVTETGKNIFCDEQLRTPFVTKKHLASMSFRHFASTPDGDGEKYYAALPGAGLPQNEKEALVVIRLANEDKVVNVISRMANDAEAINMLPPQFSKLELGNVKSVVH